MTDMYKAARCLPDSVKYQITPIPCDIIESLSRSGVPVDTVYIDGNYYVYYNWEQNGDPVGTILPTQWNQNEPFNGYCPNRWDDILNDSIRTYVGCLPVAVGQIMAHWKVSTSGTPYSNIQWAYMSSILNKNSTPSNLVGWSMLKKLLVRLGDHDNLDAKYGVTTSSHYEYVGRTFERFGYSYGGETKDYCLDSVRNALHTGPVLACGFAMQYTDPSGNQSYGRGHAWVFDQHYRRKRLVIVYDSSWHLITGHVMSASLLHINWGWGGHYDGYFANSRFARWEHLNDPLTYSSIPSMPLTKSAIDTTGTPYFYQYHLIITSRIHP